MSASLRKLDLSSNHISVIQNIEGLTNLRELNLSYNQIGEMENLHKLTNLRKLYIDRNHLKAINGIRHLRKLEKLSLNGNKIKDTQPADSAEPLLDLKEISLEDNLIDCIESVTCYPNLEDLDLSGNPLCMVFPGAFNALSKLQVLVMDNCKFKYPSKDLLFLKKLENLNRLSMNRSFPNNNFDKLELISFVQMPSLEDLSLRGVGLLLIKGIADSFPNLTNLDLADNKIFSVECVEELHKLEELAEVSFKNNPVCVHKHLAEMV